MHAANHVHVKLNVQVGQFVFSLLFLTTLLPVYDGTLVSNVVFLSFFVRRMFGSNQHKYSYLKNLMCKECANSNIWIFIKRSPHILKQLPKARLQHNYNCLLVY